jgi:murein L,D-transpeptidase YafK
MRRLFATLVLLAGGLFALNVQHPGLLHDLFEDLRLPASANRPRVTSQPPAALNSRLAAKQLALGQPVYLRIIKETSELEVWMDASQGRPTLVASAAPMPSQVPGPVPAGRGWTLLHTYPICKYSGSLGPKVREGDRQAPEGFYAIGQKSLNPHSRNHLAFDLGFPNAYDRAHGRTGTFLMVHGNCRSIGCYAMTNDGISEIYPLVENALKAGQPSVPVQIFPFRMTEANMRRRRAAPWASYWANLKDGWDHFESTRQPPVAYACGRAYKFNAPSASESCQRIDL